MGKNGVRIPVVFRPKSKVVSEEFRFLRRKERGSVDLLRIFLRIFLFPRTQLDFPSSSRNNSMLYILTEFLPPGKQNIPLFGKRRLKADFFKTYQKGLFRVGKFLGSIKVTIDTPSLSILVIHTFGNDSWTLWPCRALTINT